MFRDLQPDEIEVRVGEVYEKGLTLLLYKNARCDMAILDEVMGPMNWQREHYECKGNLFCRVGIRHQDEWVWKSDAGSPSNFEAEKGEASDAFKRACFNWGIGRELYTAPRIWAPADRVNLKKNAKGKWACYDEFAVVKTVIENHVIQCLAIKDMTTGKNAFVWMRPGYDPEGAKEEAF